MALKTFNPTTPGQRQLVMVDRSSLYKGKPVKALTEGKHVQGGRNNTGRITVRFRGGGHKKAYRIVDFKRAKIDMPGDRRAAGIRSEPHRLHRADQVYRTASRPISWRRSGWPSATPSSPATMSTSSRAMSCRSATCRSAPSSTMSRLKIGKGGQLARSAGTYAQIVGRDQDYVIVRLNSGEQRLVHGRCRGTIGAVSNPDHMNISIGKAGRNRWLGCRPHNRGVS